MTINTLLLVDSTLLDASFLQNVLVVNFSSPLPSATLLEPLYDCITAQTTFSSVFNSVEWPFKSNFAYSSRNSLNLSKISFQILSTTKYFISISIFLKQEITSSINYLHLICSSIAAIMAILVRLSFNLIFPNSDVDIEFITTPLLRKSSLSSGHTWTTQNVKIYSSKRTPIL